MDTKYTVTPPVDIYEAEDKYIVVTDMPGTTKDAIDITVSEGVLTLTGKVKEREEGWKPVLEEFAMGDYKREITVGNKVDESKIDASYSNGVLTLELAKSERAKSRKIDVKTA